MQPLFTEQPDDHAFQIVHIHAVDHIPVPAANLFDHRTAQRLGGFFALSPCRHPHEHLVFLRIGRRRRVRRIGQIGNLQRARPLAETERADHARVDDGVAPFFQERDDIMLQHGDQFGRRPRQHDDHLAGRRPHAAARRGPDVVGEDGRALGQHGLLALVLAHRRASLEVAFQTAQAVLMDLQRSARHTGDGFLGQIVVRGAQAARRNDHIAAAQRFFQRVPQPPRIIAHGAGKKQVDPDGGELARDKRRVRVDRMPKQELGPYRNDFSIHGKLGCGDERK